MFNRIAVAVLVGAGVALACIFLGMLLSSSGLPILETVGKFLSTWFWGIGVFVGLWHFFVGFNIGTRAP